MSGPGSVYPSTVSVYVEPSATLPAPVSVTVGGTFVTTTAFDPAFGKVPSSSVTDAVMV